jgi:hypothetical protein
LEFRENLFGLIGEGASTHAHELRNHTLLDTEAISHSGKVALDHRQVFQNSFPVHGTENGGLALRFLMAGVIPWPWCVVF